VQIGGNKKKRETSLTLEAELFTDETTPLNRYFALPKVELHRHLEGSLRLTTMLDIARQHGVTVPVSMFNLSGLVQVQDQDPMTFTNFLDKFKTLRLFYRSPDVIDIASLVRRWRMRPKIIAVTWNCVLRLWR
jgi:adenosine deaminase